VLEKEVTLWQKGTDELKKKLEGLEFHLIDWQHRAEGERIRASEVRPLPSSPPFHTHSHHVPQFRSLLKEREAAVEEKNTQLRRAEENLVRLRKESERQADKYKLLSTGTSSQKEAELQKEVDKLMVRFFKTPFPLGENFFVYCWLV
jgi:E3 ubiquitin-protein ligase BRE1